MAWRTRTRFDPARGSARTLLLTLVADQARTSRRRSARRHELLFDRAEHSSPAVERDLDIEHAVARPSSRQRLAVGLYSYLGMPIAEVAAIMKCADGTVKSTLSDARARLRDYLGEDFA